jgi:putative flippase GtrA
VKNLVTTLYDRFIRDAIKFVVVGGAGFLIDAGVFNLMRLGATGQGHFFQGPIGAKIVSVAVATVATWVGNRYWTFREHRRQNFVLEFVEFTIISIAGLGINLLCLWVSHYLLGYTSLLADNISGTLIGTALAMIFRFVLYRYWVYGRHRKDGLTAVKTREARAAAAAIYEDEVHVSSDPFATGPIATIPPAAASGSSGSSEGRSSGPSTPSSAA